MDAITFLTYAFIIFGLLFYFFHKYFFDSPEQVPVEDPDNKGHFLKRLPGPFCLPIVGHVQMFMKKEPNIYLAELADKYGDIFQLRLGVKTVIVLNSLELTKEAYQEWEFAGRPQLASIDALAKITNNNPPFSFASYGNRWKFLRKNATKALSLFSSSKNSRLQKLVTEAAESFAQDVQKHLGQPFNPKTTAGECIAGIIGPINFGGQFDRHDPFVQALVKLTDVIGRFLQLGTIVDYFPFGAWFAQRKLNNFVKTVGPIFGTIEKHIKDHKYNEEITDVADALYVRRQELTQDEMDKAEVTSENVQMISQVLFGAGFGTTFETLNWCLTLMAKYPEIQQKVAEELKGVVESNDGEPITLNDIRNTPYTEATLLEVFRFSALVPLNLPHYTVSPKAFRGYYVPKDAVVISNLWSAHRDPKIFKHPYEFNPNRFIISDGTVNMDMAQTIAPFSVGKRRCPGENLARQELYLLLSHIVGKFKISSVPGQEIDVENAKGGFTRRVREYEFIFNLRE